MPGSVHTDEYRSIIDRLVGARKRAGLSQVQLAENLSKPQSYISKVERGERRLDIVEFCKFAEGLGYEPALLLEELWNPGTTEI